MLDTGLNIILLYRGDAIIGLNAVMVLQQSGHIGVLPYLITETTPLFLHQSVQTTKKIGKTEHYWPFLNGNHSSITGPLSGETTSGWWFSLHRRSVMPHFPDSKVHGANMRPTWVLSAPDGPHVGPMNLAIIVVSLSSHHNWHVNYPSPSASWFISSIGKDYQSLRYLNVGKW